MSNVRHSGQPASSSSRHYEAVGANISLDDLFSQLDSEPAAVSAPPQPLKKVVTISIGGNEYSVLVSGEETEESNKFRLLEPKAVKDLFIRENAVVRDFLTKVVTQPSVLASTEMLKHLRLVFTTVLSNTVQINEFCITHSLTPGVVSVWIQNNVLGKMVNEWKVATQKQKYGFDGADLIPLQMISTYHLMQVKEVMKKTDERITVERLRHMKEMQDIESEKNNSLRSMGKWIEFVQLCKGFSNQTSEIKQVVRNAYDADSRASGISFMEFAQEYWNMAKYDYMVKFLQDNAGDNDVISYFRQAVTADRE
jgi:hypothetical protein